MFKLTRGVTRVFSTMIAGTYSDVSMELYPLSGCICSRSRYITQWISLGRAKLSAVGYMTSWSTTIVVGDVERGGLHRGKRGLGLDISLLQKLDGAKYHKGKVFGDGVVSLQ
jgi:hypothetical protein